MTRTRNSALVEYVNPLGKVSSFGAVVVAQPVKVLAMKVCEPSPHDGGQNRLRSSDCAFPHCIKFEISPTVPIVLCWSVFSFLIQQHFTFSSSLTLVSFCQYNSLVYLLIILSHLFVCVGRAWICQGELVEVRGWLLRARLSSALHHAGLRDWTPVVRLGSKHPYWLRHLSGVCLFVCLLVFLCTTVTFLKNIGLGSCFIDCL